MSPSPCVNAERGPIEGSSNQPGSRCGGGVSGLERPFWAGNAPVTPALGLTTGLGPPWRMDSARWRARHAGLRPEARRAAPSVGRSRTGCRSAGATTRPCTSRVPWGEIPCGCISSPVPADAALRRAVPGNRRAPPLAAVPQQNLPGLEIPPRMRQGEPCAARGSFGTRPQGWPFRARSGWCVWQPWSSYLSAR